MELKDFEIIAKRVKDLPFGLLLNVFPFQKTVVSWELDTQNASARSLVSTGKAGASRQLGLER